MSTSCDDLVESPKKNVTAVSFLSFFLEASRRRISEDDASYGSKMRIGYSGSIIYIFEVFSVVIGYESSLLDIFSRYWIRSFVP